MALSNVNEDVFFSFRVASEATEDTAKFAIRKGFDELVFVEPIIIVIERTESHGLEQEISERIRRARRTGMTAKNA